jgi:hypothetical protein
MRPVNPMDENALRSFLRERFAEDEQASPVVHDVSVCSSPPVMWDSCPCGVPRRWLLHLMARRRLALESSEEQLRLLADPYRDHPHVHPAWALRTDLAAWENAQTGR